MAQWLVRRISDQGVPGSNPGRCTFRCGLDTPVPEGVSVNMRGPEKFVP